MARDIVFKCQYFTAVSDAQVKRLRSTPAALAKFLSQNPGHGLDRYWHAVPYLITGRATRLKEPLRWFVDGGEVIGANDAGSIRYLSADEAARLAEALAEEPPDELGHTHWDEAGMDAAGVYPQRWVRDGEDHDQLGTIRELYSYVRDFILASQRDRKGVIIYLKEELAFTEEEGEAAPPTAVAAAPPIVQPAGNVVLVTADGRSFARADAAAHPKATPEMLREADAAMTRLAYRHLGDLAVRETDVVRAYLSQDHTVVAIAYFGDRGLGSWTFIAPLESGALVVASTAFTQEIKKVKLFGVSLSRAEPAGLHQSVVERRPPLEKKHGAPVVMEPTLVAAGRVWESYGEKYRIGPRR